MEYVRFVPVDRRMDSPYRYLGNTYLVHLCLWSLFKCDLHVKEKSTNSNSICNCNRGCFPNRQKTALHSANN